MLRTDSMSAVKGAVAPVVTKQSFESGVHFQDSVSVSSVGGTGGITKAKFASFKIPKSSLQCDLKMVVVSCKAEVGPSPPPIGPPFAPSTPSINGNITKS